MQALLGLAVEGRDSRSRSERLGLEEEGRGFGRRLPAQLARRRVRGAHGLVDAEEGASASDSAGTAALQV